MKKITFGMIGFTLFIILFLNACSSKDITTNAVCDLKEGCGSGYLSSSDGSDGLVRIPVSEVSSTLKKYTFDADGTQVTFFAVKGSDGKVRTAFDACDVCGGYKGYRQEGNDIVCNNCGRTFSIDGLGTQNKGYGCWPSFLSHAVEGGDIVIKQSELKQGAFRFA